MRSGALLIFATVMAFIIFVPSEDADGWPVFSPRTPRVDLEYKVYQGFVAGEWEQIASPNGVDLAYTNPKTPELVLIVSRTNTHMIIDGETLAFVNDTNVRRIKEHVYGSDDVEVYAKIADANDRLASDKPRPEDKAVGLLDRL